MKRAPAWVALALSVFFFALMGCGGGGGGGGSSPKGEATVLIYIVGSSLESGGGAATADIVEMAKIGSTKNLNVIITTGGANKEGWTTVMRHKVIDGDVQTLAELGALNMGDPDTLQDFIEWGIETYPADKYHLIMWDHGSGADGFGGDEVHEGNKLTLDEMDQAFSGAKLASGVTFETIGFDACLMASYEIAALAAPYAKYLVASEELEPGHGWNYTSILRAIKDKPAIGGEALGKVIADSYKAQANSVASSVRADGEAYTSEKTVTLSVIDLNKIQDLAAAWEALMGVATPTNNEEYLSFGKAAYDSWRFGQGQKSGQGNSNMVDMADLALQFSDDYPTEVANVIDAVDEAVAYKIAGAYQAKAKGISIKIPKATSELEAYEGESSLTGFLDALFEYIFYVEADTTPPEFSNESIDWEEEEYKADVAGDDIAALYATVWYQDDLGNPLLLGMDTPTSWVGNAVTYGLPTAWMTLDESYVSVFVIYENDNMFKLDIPALLNDEPVDIFVWLDTDSMEFEIIGAWPGYDDGMAEKQILSIGDGDEITPLFGTVDEFGEWAYVEGTPFTVSGTPSLGIAPLPTGTYNVAFYAEDYAGNGASSDIIAGEYSLAKTAQRAAQQLNGQATKIKVLQKITKMRGAKSR